MNLILQPDPVRKWKFIYLTLYSDGSRPLFDHTNTQIRHKNGGTHTDEKQQYRNSVYPDIRTCHFVLVFLTIIYLTVCLFSFVILIIWSQIRVKFLFSETFFHSTIINCRTLHMSGLDIYDVIQLCAKLNTNCFNHLIKAIPDRMGS